MSIGNKSHYLSLLFVSLFLTSKISAQANDTKNEYSIWGKYCSYKMEYENVTEMSYSDAKKFLNKCMLLQPSIFTLFDDTIVNPEYTNRDIPRAKFFSEYDVNEEKFGALNKFLHIILVKKDKTFEETRIIVTGNYLIANYKGYFYFFKKKE